MTEGTEYEGQPVPIEAVNDQPDVVEPAPAPTESAAPEPAQELAEVATGSAPVLEVLASEPAEDEPSAGTEIAEPIELAELAESDEPAADDVAAAIAEAGENLEAEPTFDDIAPGTVAVDRECDVIGAVEPDEHANSVSIWPFVAYDVLWLAFVGVLIWQLQPLPADRAVFESSVYPLAIVAGAVLTIAGPLLILAAWIATWGRPGSTKGGLFFSALIKGSVATLIGVVLWWGALIMLDQIRLGRLL